MNTVSEGMKNLKYFKGSKSHKINQIEIPKLKNHSIYNLRTPKN